MSRVGNKLHQIGPTRRHANNSTNFHLIRRRRSWGFGLTKEAKEKVEAEYKAKMLALGVTGERKTEERKRLSNEIHLDRVRRNKKGKSKITLPAITALTETTDDQNE